MLGYKYGYRFKLSDSYKPYINYSWSSTYQKNNQMHSKNSGTGTPLALYSGQGVKFNGVDQVIDGGDISTSLSIEHSVIVYSTTTFSDAKVNLWVEPNKLNWYDSTVTKQVRTIPVGILCLNIFENKIDVYHNGVFYSTFNTDGYHYYKYNTYGARQSNGEHASQGTLKDLFIFNRALTQTEITKYSTNPNGFFNDALVDDTCVLNMPLAEHSTDCYDYANDTWHTISNYTDSCRNEAKQLPYGSQNANYKINNLGMRTDESSYLECDGVGYGDTGWVPSVDEDFTVEAVFEVSNDSEFRLNGNSYNNGIYFGKNSGGKTLYVRVFGSNVLQLPNTKDIACLIFSYEWQTKEVKQYVDDVLVATQLATQTTNVLTPVLLGMGATNGAYALIKPVRLFKVHQKALTQAEITKNYNSYVAKGLLS